MKTVLTIAGSDPSGGAGIQADIKTFCAHGVYAMAAVSAVTAQNTLEVTAVEPVPPRLLTQQLDAVFTDIFPDAVKIGMTASAEQARIIAERLKFYGARHVVADTVAIASTGAELSPQSAFSALCENIFPLAEIITPNIGEAERIAEIPIKTPRDMERAARIIREKYGCAVLCKGGHSADNADDLFLSASGECVILPAERIDNPNTHGTGCTLSSAIAANLALGRDLLTAVKLAKEYITGAIRAGLNIGKGNGPLDHLYKFNIQGN